VAGDRKRRSRRQSILVFILFLLLGAAAAVSERQAALDFLAKGIARAAPGGDSQEQRIFYRIDGGKKKEMTLHVNPQVLDEKAAMQLLKQARDIWTGEYLGGNASPERVTQDLNLPDQLQDGMVQVTYSFDDLTAINAQGEVQTEELTKAGRPVTLTAEFAYEDWRLLERKQLTLVKGELSSGRQLEEDVRVSAEAQEQKSRQNSYVRLPTQVDGHRITWSQENSSRWILFPLLGAAMVFALRFRSIEQERKAKKQRDTQFQREYPQLVDQMSLLLGSGMTVFGAWEKMVRSYRYLIQTHQTEEKLYLEEMTVTYREIRDGRGERESYERFGNRIGLQCYRRFASLLSQNMEKGTRDIRGILEQEAREALALRQTNARRQGEEAGSRLLGPMLLMFVTILVTVLVPASQNL
jgi:tight adherence protein C